MAPKRGGTNTQSRQFGAVISTTQTFVDEYDYEGAFEASLKSRSDVANSSTRVIDKCANGKLLMEVQETSQAFPLNVIQWTVKPSSVQEKTTVDHNGDAIILKYATSLDWATELGGTGMAFQYTKYTDQTGEADIYVPTKEISGRMYTIVAKGQVVNTITSLRVWDYTINSTAFFGYPKGCVLSFGVGFNQIARRPNGDHLVELDYRFMAKPGSLLSQWSESGTVAAGGWNSWLYWKDPNSGAVPKDIRTTTDAVKEVQHYELKDFTTLYQLS